MRRVVLAALVIGYLSFGSAQAEAVTLEWDPNPEPDIAGYSLSYGTAPGQYTSTIDVGNVTSYQFSEPNPALRYYLAVSAYNTDGATGAYSNEVFTTPAQAPLSVTGLTSNRTSPQPVGTSITFTAIAGGGIAPHRFKWWIVNGTTTTVGQNWSTNSAFTWTPTVPGSTYIVRVWARNASSTADAPDNPGAALEMTFTITSGGTTNQAPTVNAGADRSITLPSSATLSGTVSDDGQPTPPGTVTLTWTRASGPGTVVFSAPNAATTSASFSMAGTYVLRLTASDGALSRSDDLTASVGPVGGGGGTGTGLTGQYFNDPGPGAYFTTLVTTRVDATVNFGWTGSAVPGGQADNFSARWTGQVRAVQSGSYRFATMSDDGVRLWVNGQLVIDNWTDHGPTMNTSPVIILTAGVRYDIRLEFYAASGSAQVQLAWIPPGQTLRVIPSAQLYP